MLDAGFSHLRCSCVCCCRCCCAWGIFWWWSLLFVFFVCKSGENSIYLMGDFSLLIKSDGKCQRPAGHRVFSPSWFLPGKIFFHGSESLLLWGSGSSSFVAAQLIGIEESLKKQIFVPILVPPNIRFYQFHNQRQVNPFYEIPLPHPRKKFGQNC